MELDQTLTSRDIINAQMQQILDVATDAWERPYSREQALFPVPGLRQDKYFPPVSRIDNAYGDRNLMCACPPAEAFEEA